MQSRMRRYLARAVLAALCFFGAIANASLCVTPSLEELYAKSDNAFTARIIGGEVTGERFGNSHRLRTRFEVTEIFKGQIPFEHFKSHADGNTYGISLRIGADYLVFAPDSGAIGLCSGIVQISGLAPEHEARGRKYVTALRNFKEGRADSLADPWHFVRHEGVCSLSGRFPWGDSGWPANIRMSYWYRTPDWLVADPEKPQLKAGYTNMEIRVPAREDLTGHPLIVSVGAANFEFDWTISRYSGSSYKIDAESVAEFVRELASVSSIRLQSSHPSLGEVTVEASLANAGDSVFDMVECLERRPAE